MLCNTEVLGFEDVVQHGDAGCGVCYMAKVIQKSMKILNNNFKKALYDIGTYFCGVW